MYAAFSSCFLVWKYIPPVSHFYTEKFGVCRGIQLFFIFAPKHRLQRRFKHVPKINAWSENVKNICYQNFYNEFSIFTAEKNLHMNASSGSKSRRGKKKRRREDESSEEESLSVNASLRDEVKHVPVSLSVDVSLRDEVKHVPVSLSVDASLRDEVKHVPVSLSVDVSLRDEVKHVPVSLSANVS